MYSALPIAVVRRLMRFLLATAWHLLWHDRQYCSYDCCSDGTCVTDLCSNNTCECGECDAHAQSTHNGHKLYQVMSITGVS